jgi:hypothetical protein
MSDFIELAVLLVLAWLVLRFVAGRIGGRPGQPTEPGDYAVRPARLRPRPGRGSAAVALAEPDEEEDEDEPPQRPRSL